MTRASHFASGYKVSPVLNKTTHVPSETALKCAFFCWQGSFLLLTVIAHTYPGEETNQALFQADNFLLKPSNMSKLNQCLQAFKVLWEISWKELSPVAGKPGGPGCPAGPCGPAGPMGPTLPGSPFMPWHTMKTIVKPVRTFFCILFYIKNSNLSVQVDKNSKGNTINLIWEINWIEYIFYFARIHYVQNYNVPHFLSIFAVEVCRHVRCIFSAKYVFPLCSK